MLKSLKIWWLEKQHRHLVEALALARKYQRQENLFMQRTIIKLEAEKQRTVLRLINLKQESAQDTRHAEHA